MVKIPEITIISYRRVKMNWIMKRFDINNPCGRLEFVMLHVIGYIFFSTIYFMTLSLILTLFSNSSSEPSILIVKLLNIAVCSAYFLVVSFRRMKDINDPRWYAIMLFIPGVNLLYFLVLTIKTR
jgi:hypothetical protein